VKNVVREIVILCIACVVACALGSCGGAPASAARSGPSSSAKGTTVSGSVPEMSFVRIPAGTFEMGSGANPSSDQSPSHGVTITRAFELQTTEVTQAQWRAVMGDDPSHFQGDDRPVEQVSWNEAQEFIRRLNKLDRGKAYRLATEAEWEYACRAGSAERGFPDLDESAWWHRNSENQTHPVAQMKPNAWGLYDMLGNVWEYCADWKDSYPAGHMSDPAGPSHGYYKVSRGGSWFDVPAAANPTFRSSPAPDDRGNSQGFRLARSIVD
jgi:formylglycine-generating enzyme required for sulfatase activity